MNKSIGQPVRRLEDRRLLTGRGRFSDDHSLPGQAHASVVRSPYPHAEIISIDSTGAAAMPGVLGVFAGADGAADGLADIPHSPVPSTKNDLKLTAPDGSREIFIGPHVPLPADRARHMGEAVAMVVAETRAQAEDAAEAVEISWRERPYVTDGAAAVDGDGAALWDGLPGNVCVDTVFGAPEAADRAFENAPHVVRHRFHIERVTGVPLEPRSALGNYDAATGRYTLYAGSGGAVRQKREIAAVLGEEPDAVRVISLDVGGNFGTKNRVYVEFPLVLWASKRLGRPVKYTCLRSEAFLTDYQGRDLVTTVELALDHDGRFLGLRADNISNVGARAVSFSPLGKGSSLVTGPYDIPAASVRSRAVFTNTVPTQAYRSSGRPEVTYAIERMVDLAAVELGFDRIELRRKNLIASSAMPYANPFGMNYDSGDYAESMRRAMAAADWDGRDARRAEALSRGKWLGVGFANYVESSIGTPREQARISIDPAGTVEVVIGTQPAGQGHETSFAQVAADWLGVAVDQVKIVLGDTDIVEVGGGSHSGRSMRMAGTVITMAADELIEKAKPQAAEVLEAAAADVTFEDGRFVVAGTDRGVDWFDLAREVPPANLTVTRENFMDTPVFPNGCHICEVELDPETGAYQIVRYVTVDDVGRAINPMIVHGQTHGGIVQGVGQALGEAMVLDPASGQTLSGSLMDYPLPRADEFPSFQTELHEVPSPTNPLGVKAGGEGGTTPAPAVMVSAVSDALAAHGIHHIELPLTPHRVWQAMQAANT